VTEAGVSALYNSYRPIIYRHCRFMLRDRVAAEDATQEIFLKVIEHLERVPASDEALLWLYRVATNHCLNELRYARRRANAHSIADREPTSSGGETGLADRDLVQRILAQAPRHTRASAWLRHVDGMTHNEVGRTLGLSRRTIFNHLAGFQEVARKLLHAPGGDRQCR
jgi:RNA polymerase sigma-70 factor (ECF subfamily)